MSSKIEKILLQIGELQDQLEAEIAERGKAFRYRLDNGRVVFDSETLRRHRALRIGFLDFIKRARLLVLVTAPVIYGLIVPFVLLDICVSIYQTVCFPVYRIPKVPRSDYIRIDRHRLAYLNGVQKLNCVFCGYTNGLIAWVREVAARTEAFWCPIKHAAPVKGAHEHYVQFLDFGDAEKFDAGVEMSRRDLSRQDAEN